MSPRPHLETLDLPHLPAQLRLQAHSTTAQSSMKTLDAHGEVGREAGRQGQRQP